MIVFDKTEHNNLANAKRIEEIHSELLASSRDKNISKRSELLAELDQVLATHQELVDRTPIYTCAACGSDFEQGKHVDIIAKSVVVWNDNGEVEQWIDDGQLRHFKFCAGCVDGFSVHPREYATAR
jgi:hypothetical protein